MQTIGERLEEARKRKGISIREASEATKIRSDYLQKFENNTFELNLPDIYIRGFLRTYTQYLKLNAEKILTDYASLGYGEPRSESRRQDQREIMGRLDLPDAGKAAPVAPAEPPSPRSQPAQPRSTPTAVVTGAPSADRRQKMKMPVIAGGAALALLILIILVRALWPSSDPTPRSTTTNATVSNTTAPAPVGDVIKLIAVDNVQVKVTQQSDNRILFEGDLIKGDTRFIQKNGKVYVTYNPGKNLQVEIRGQRFKMSIDGWGKNTLE